MGDGSRLFGHATRAFVDRAGVDWTALLQRVAGSPEHSLFENLHAVAAIRRAAGPGRNDASRASRFLVGTIVALAACHTAAAIGILVVAMGNGVTASGRSAQVMLTVVFAAMFLLLATSATHDRRTLVLVAWFGCIVGPFARSAVTGLPEPWATPLGGLFERVALEALAPACLWQFALEFPRVLRFTRFDVVARGVTRVVWIIGIALLLANLVDAGEVHGASFPYLSRNHPGNLFWHVITFMLIPAVGVILIRSRRAAPLERSRVMGFASALAAGTAPFLVHGVVLAVSPRASAWLRAAPAHERFWLDLVVITGLAATPLLTMIAVVVNRPFELHAVFGRGGVYSLARVIVCALPLAPFAGFATLLYQRREASVAEVFTHSDGVRLAACAAAAALLLAIRSRLLDALDRKMSQRSTDHSEQLARAFERVRLARGTRETAVVLSRELRRGTGARTAAMFVRDQAGRFTDQTALLAPLPSDSSLLAILRDTTGPLDVSANSELRDLLPPSDTEWVTQSEAALIAPLKLRDETIGAIAVLGPKPAGLPFNRSDQWLIAALTTAVAATWTAEGDANGTERRERDQSKKGDREAAFECPRCAIVGDSPDLPCSCDAPPILAALPVRLREKFLVVRRLGTGGMGVVYLAHDEELDRDVALKTLMQLAPGAVPRLQDEARAMAVLNHDSLATIYGIEVWRRTPVLVVEYLAGGTLAHRLVGGPLSTAETIDIGARVARALASMHASGVLHRDLKPSNIGFTSAGAPKLLDFGLAVLAEATASGLAPMRHAAHAGTPAYLPPESFHGARPGPAFDLWALAVVLLECVSGNNPFADVDRASTIHRVATFKALALPLALRTAYPALSGFFERALDRNREQRFQTAPEFLSTLEALTAPDAIVRSSIDSRR